MGLSLNAFAQTYGPQSRDPAAGSAEPQGSTQDRIDAQRSAGENRCAALRGPAQARCLDAEANASGGASGIPRTQQPGASGPGATDNTHPGDRQGVSRDVGTSSAGSGT